MSNLTQEFDIYLTGWKSMKNICLLMLVLVLCACGPALAKTPKDMLVMAD
jgi:hypothetical protein